MGPAAVIIDTDPATGCAFKDVDDGLALLYVLALPSELRVAGVTAVFGNAPLRRTLPEAGEILRLARREDVPLAGGAAAAKQLGEETPASRLLVEQAALHPGEVTVLALGPLTNIATAGMSDPGFYANVRRLVLMGGALEEGFGLPLLPPLEFNFMKDSDAADLVLAAECEKIVITADLCRQLVFTRRELDSLWRMGSRVSTYLAYRTGPWLRLNQLAPLPWKGGFVPWDVIAAVYLRRPELFAGTEERGMAVKGGRFATGGIVPCPSRDGSPCSVPRSIDGDAISDEFLGAVSRYPL